jgi:peptidoglycan/LPS O-acetylase OafA/YrhL
MQKSFFPNLESLRGLAAIFVLLFHTKKETILKLIPFVEKGHVFVDFFFVLSGFIIAYNYEKKIHTFIDRKIFILKRIFRLFPLHIFVMLFAALSCIIAPKPNISETYITFIIEFLLLQAIPPFIFLYAYKWNVPAWSISTELWTYFLFIPLLIRPSKIVTIGIFVTIYLLTYFPIIPSLHLDGFTLLLRCISAFALGNFTYKLYLNNNWLFSNNLMLSKILDSIVLIFICLTFFLSLHIVKSYYAELVLTFLFAVLILCATKEHFILTKLLKTRIALYLGKLSYSIYLTHSIIILYASKFMSIALRIPWQEQHKTILYPILVLIFTVIFSHFTYKFIERPFKNLYKRFI